MEAILNFLNGKKTYLTCALALIVIALWMGGLLEPGTAEQALIALGFGGAITLRAAIAKAQAAQQAGQASPPTNQS